MNDKIYSGKRGEAKAANYLRKKGYLILEQNYRYKRSEIDIIAQKDDVVVFVEVKARSSAAYGHPEEAVKKNKVKKILEGAENYVLENDWTGRIRFDIMAVDLKSTAITHFEDAFG